MNIQTIIKIKCQKRNTDSKQHQLLAILHTNADSQQNQNIVIKIMTSIVAIS